MADAPSVPQEAGTDAAIARALDAVDFEISLIRETRNAPGWTTWALLPSIAGLLWLLLGYLGRPASLTRSLRAYFVISLVLQLLAVLALWIKGDSTTATPTNERRLRPFGVNMDLTAGRLSIAALLPFVLLDWWIALFLWPEAPRSAVMAVSVYFGIWCLVLLIFLVARAFNVSVSVGNSDGAWRVHCVFATLLAWPTIYFVSEITRQRTVSVDEWKIAGLLAAIGYLGAVLLRLAEEPRLLGPLVALRRDIVFRRIEVDHALRQLDITIAGMQPSDMLQREVESLLSLLRQHGEELRAMVKESNAMRLAIAKSEDREGMFSKDDVERWYKPHQASLTARASAVSRELDKYYRRARWLVAGDAVAKAKGDDIRGRISAEVGALSEQGQEMRSSVDALVKETLSKRAKPESEA